MQALGLAVVAVLAVSGGEREAELKVRYATQQKAARKAQQMAVAQAAQRYIPAPPVLSLVQGVAPGLEQGAMGTAAYSRDTNTVYYQGKLDPATKAHELGHAFDDQVLTDGDRRYFQRLMQAPAGEWRSGTGMHGGYASPSEWFADYYQASALGLDPRRQNEAAYTTIGPKRLKQFEKALQRLAKRHKLQPYQ